MHSSRPGGASRSGAYLIMINAAFFFDTKIEVVRIGDRGVVGVGTPCVARECGRLSWAHR